MNVPPKEFFTIKELAQIFNVSRQAITKHINKLDDLYLGKNAKGYKTVTLFGVRILAQKIDCNELPEWLLSDSLDTRYTIDFIGGNSVQSELLNQLHVKDKEIEKLTQLLDQQQQLTLKANNQIEQLQSQMNLLLSEPEKEKTSRLKKWWQYWK